MDEMLIWSLLALFAVLLIIPVLMGVLLPAVRQATRVELIKAPIDKVWVTLSELTRQTEWRPDLKSVQMKDDDEGMRWVEQPKRGWRRILRKKKEIAERELLILVEESGSTQGTRHFLLSDVPGGTRVTMTQSSDIRSPYARFRAHLSNKLDKRVNRFMQQLKDHYQSV